jgi:hypothetical protein
MQIGVNFFHNQRTLILAQIMLNLEIVCGTLNRIFGVAFQLDGLWM